MWSTTSTNPSSGWIVLFIHGFYSTKETSSRILADILEKNNINSFRIDLDNRGESEPKFEEGSISQYVSTALAATEFLKEQGFEEIHFCGSSYGGVVGLMAAQQFPYKSLVLRCPGAGMWKRLDEFENKVSWSYTSGKTGETYTMGIQFYEEIKDVSLNELAKKIKMPTLIIHGTKDTTCPISWSEEMAAVNPKIELVPIPGAEHGLNIDGDYSLSQKALFEWFEQFKK